MFISEIRAQYRDAESLLFHTVVKRIYEEQVGERWVVRKVEIVSISNQWPVTSDQLRKEASFW